MARGQDPPGEWRIEFLVPSGRFRVGPVLVPKAFLGLARDEPACRLAEVVAISTRVASSNSGFCSSILSSITSV
jgi:hypothetical protein